VPAVVVCLSFSSKIEAGHLVLNRASHNINEVVESAVLLCYGMASSKGLDFSWFVDPSLPASLLVDSTRLQQILLNLVSNAIKFTRTGGQVDVELLGHPVPAEPDDDPSAPTRVQLTIKVQVRVSIRGSWHVRATSIGALRTMFALPTSHFRLLLSSTCLTCVCCRAVQDTGIGISAEQLPKLFKSFSQSVMHSSTFACGSLGSRHPVHVRGAGPLTPIVIVLSLALFALVRLCGLSFRVHHASGEYGGTGE